ncbi:carotenoid oxygenase [Aspergillus avenaceus]|uniref:Carotenoid oxygenase n=1 Tax=Aspergillus avenaceus TaxID=36643 RepID=A0A5N6U1S7_ASPAV|nr:carotenoid oxygenase [Aspergillus avenaceus]
MSAPANGVYCAQHYNGWPNVQGFSADFEERLPVELAVSGYIPPYAAGALYRTGPGKCQVDMENGDKFQVSHWFDGFSETHRFQLVAAVNDQSTMKVFYNSRFSTDYLIEKARTTGHLSKISFGQKRDPCKTVFQKFQSDFVPDPSSTNVGVTFSVNMPGLGSDGPNGQDSEGRWTGGSGIDSLYAKTDSCAYKRLDPETLEPVGLATQRDLHPELGGPLSASHARSDPLTGDVYNFNLSFGQPSTYRIFHVSASSGKTTVLATFHGTPAYLHSLFLTEGYVVLCIWNSHINPAKFLNGSFTQAIQPYDASKPAMWYVVDRRNGQGLVATYESPPFFCFHTINAWQESSADDPSNTDVIAEFVRFDNLDTLHGLYYENMLSSSATAKAYTETRGKYCRSEFARFRLPSIPSSPDQEIKTAMPEWTSCKAYSPELPAMNPKLATRRHRYTYAITASGKSTFFDGILKFDSETKETLLWTHHAQSPGEPIFVPDPDGSDEDDGVLLSVVLNGYTGKSYLLCVDARDLQELGRADVNGPVAFGFHGQHVPVRGVPTGDY